MVAPKIDEQKQIFTDGDMSGTIISLEVPLLAFRSLSVQAIWTGTPTGNLQLEVSNDGSTWAAEGSSVATGAAAGDSMFTATVAPWQRARLVFTFSAGTGVLNAFAIAKT